MSATNRSSGSGMNGEQLLPWIFVGLALGGGGLVWVSVTLGSRWAGVDLPEGNPIERILSAFGVGVPASTWAQPESTIVAGAVALLLVVLLVLIVVLRVRKGGRRSRVDAAGAHMGRGRDISALSRQNAMSTAKRLGVAENKSAPGLPVAKTLAGQPLFSTWEDVTLDIWGPRTGKTTSRAIPAIMAAPGPVVATSNKRDLTDATRGPRAELGKVWVFDPQQIVDEPQTWWWNPLTYVTDEVQATKMARSFAAFSKDPDSRVDAYFDTAGLDLLTGLLLAAAEDNRPLTDVHHWLTHPTDDEAAQILREKDYPLLATSVQATINTPEKQRAGVYGTALKMCGFMVNRQAMAWVSPPPATRRHEVAEFDPAPFVRSAGTLYALSKEGGGSAGPLVTAMTVAVTEAAEGYARTQPGGRLAVPMVAVLDEAANVCKWRDLPDLYSHYGSRGITISTILQSWSQGVEVWGKEGMRKLWSAANVAVYGGGARETEFLRDLSELIGEYERPNRTVSHGKSGRQVSTQYQRERILDVADLQAMPRGRAVVLASGARATLVQTVPWMNGPHAEQIKASIAVHDPQAERTIDTLVVGVDTATREAGRWDQHVS